MQLFQPLVFLLCALTSAICLGLLVRGYVRSRNRLLLWSALCFLGLAINNTLLFLDVVVLPGIDLLPLRHASAVAALFVLIWGFIWETEP